MRRLTDSPIIEWAGCFILVLSLFCLGFGTYVWAVETIPTVDAAQNVAIAVLASQLVDLTRRVTNVEERLWGILLTTIATVLASVTSSFFSIRTHRQVKRNGKSNP